MGSSSKKKKEKKKDFAKPKLKVGKAKPKASNFTDTSFKSKALVLAAQSLHHHTPTQSHLLTHHLSLLTHHSNSTRRESLAYLTTHLPPTFTPFPTSQPPADATSINSTVPPPISPATLIASLSPLILDPSVSVRTQLLTLLQTLPPRTHVEAHVGKVMLYVNSAMTHITSEIRADSTKFLSWLLSISSDAVLRNGGWTKGIWGLIGVLGWGAAKDSRVMFAGGGTPSGGAKGKITLQHLGVLREFLMSGLYDCQSDNEHGNHNQRTSGHTHIYGGQTQSQSQGQSHGHVSSGLIVASVNKSDNNNNESVNGPGRNSGITSPDEAWRPGTPHWTSHLHMLPSRPSHSNAYSYLGLFTPAAATMSNGEGDGSAIEDLSARKRWLLEAGGGDALMCIRRGLEAVRREGGEVGRLGGKVLAVLEDALEDGSESD